MNDYSDDLPPEFCHYPDEGCEFSETCLNCPLPVCIYDEPRGKHRLLRKKRANEMTQLYAKGGKTVRELARIYKVSRRTVQRTLKVAVGDSASEAIDASEKNEDSANLSMISPSFQPSPVKGKRGKKRTLKVIFGENGIYSTIEE